MKQVTVICDSFHTRYAIAHSILFQLEDVAFLFITIKKKVIEIKSIHPERLYLGPPKTDVSNSLKILVHW